MRAALFVLVTGLALSSADTRADEPPKYWEFRGRAQADAVEVRARVTGPLNSVAVREGDTVTKGAVLAEIDPRSYKLARDVALARVKVAEAKLQAAKIATANAKRLLKGGAGGADEVAPHEAAEAEATAALAVAKAEAQLAELNLSFTRITAPFGGRVGRVQSTTGNHAVAYQTPILTVVATDLYVSFEVHERDYLPLARANKANPGKLTVAVGFIGEKGYPHEGKLDAGAPGGDPITGTARFRVSVPNPTGDLVPGLLADVRLTPAPK